MHKFHIGEEARLKVTLISGHKQFLGIEDNAFLEAGAEVRIVGLPGETNLPLIQSFVKEDVFQLYEIEPLSGSIDRRCYCFEHQLEKKHSSWDDLEEITGTKLGKPVKILEFEEV